MTKIEFGYAVVVVLGIVFVKAPVSTKVKGGTEVHVSVLEFCQHVAQHFEQLGVGHVLVDFIGIASMNLIPIHTQLLFLVVEKAIVLIHDAPQCLIVALLGVVVVVFLHTGGESEQ